MKGFWAILIKEFSHIRRDRGTLIFAFLVPAFQLTIFGYAIDVTIENIPVVVLNLDQRQDSREFLDALVATGTFEVIERVEDMDSFRRALSAGWARVGVLIPPDYSDKLLRREQAQVQVLIDGSDSQVATTALNAVGLLGTQLSIARAKGLAESVELGPARTETGQVALPIDVRPRLLFNPNLESSHFFVPGLIAIILQVVLLFLTSFSIVREREHGTLEQLFVTPVGRAGLLFGKLIPYAFLAVGELMIVLFLMVALFGVPIHGSLTLLLGLSILFIVTSLGLGLLVSTIAKTQLQSMQMAFVVMLPSVLLSGFVFPRAEMPLPIYLISFILPVTYYIEILRGIVLREADLIDLVPHIIGLTVCCAVILGISLTRFSKRLD